MLRHGILGLLSINDYTGYDISITFSQVLSYFWMANQSQIYRELNKMEKDGLVNSYKVAQANHPDKRVYSITEGGKNHLLQWLNDEGMEQLLVIRCPILMKLFFADSLPKEKVVALLKSFREKCAEKLKEVEALTVDAPPPQEDKLPLWQYTTDYCINYYNFLMDWSTKTVTDILNRSK